MEIILFGASWLHEICHGVWEQLLKGGVEQKLALPPGVGSLQK